MAYRMTSILNVPARAYKTPLAQSVVLRPELPPGVLSEVSVKTCRKLTDRQYVDGQRPQQQRAWVDRAGAEERQLLIHSVRERRDPRDRGEALSDARRREAHDRLLGYGIQNPTRSEIDDELRVMDREVSAEQALVVALAEMEKEAQKRVREPEVVQVERRMVWVDAARAPSKGGRKMR